MRAQGESHPLVAALVYHYDELVCYARSLFQGRGTHQASDMAREAVHEVCLQLLHQQPATDQIRIPLAFLRTLSRHRAIDGLRKEAQWQQLAGSLELHPEALSQANATSQQPEQRYAASQQLHMLVQAIESLPPRCHEVFVLHHVHQWPQRQVAEHLGISIKTVEKHLRIGLACCRYALADVLAEMPARQP